MDEQRSYRLRQAVLIYRPGHQDAPVGRFYDGDIIRFTGRVNGDPLPPIEVDEEERQCFRLGNGGSTLTPVERGSWLP